MIALEIRRGTAAEMLALCGGQRISVESPTALYFHRNVESGNAEFWLIESDGDIVGELYAFHRLDDADFADGVNRSYLCAFSVRKDLRGRGLGTALMARVLESLRAQRFAEATIGVDVREEANIRLYRRIGFVEPVKLSDVDPCMLDENWQPTSCAKFALLKKALRE